MDLREVLSFCQGRVLDDCAPAFRVGEAGVPDGFEQLIASIYGGNWPVQGILDHLARSE